MPHEFKSSINVLASMQMRTLAGSNCDPVLEGLPEANLLLRWGDRSSYLAILWGDELRISAQIDPSDFIEKAIFCPVALACFSSKKQHVQCYRHYHVSR